MEKHCPLFVDFTRECIKKIEDYPAKVSFKMLQFCQSEEHVDCPFYKILETDENVCEKITKCPAFKKFKNGEFDKFVDVSNRFCTSEKHTECARFKTSRKGAVPESLHPDGHTVEEWK
ncbi:hypothetical protein ACFL08_00970 [Patescibacteria group bacterium]